MYSWGGSTAGWKKPGGYSYNSARKPYLDSMAAASKARGGRKYAMRSEPDWNLVHTGNKEIVSESENPIIVAVDVTGSMCKWPGEIFDRLPLIYQTLSQYREDVELCFAAIGDANTDSYPIQVNSFGKGVTLEDHVKALCPEGGGGGQLSESYELFAHYVLNHCKTPKAKSPFLLIYGDEKFYNRIEPDQVKHFIGDQLQNSIDSASVFRALTQKFNLFYMQKPYGEENSPETDREVAAHWAKAIGKERIVKLPSMERAVDVGMAIIARYWGKFGDFSKNMASRQDSSAIAKVTKSIRYIGVDPNAPITRASKLLADGGGDQSQRLDR